MFNAFPRAVFAGSAGDSGKTLVSLSVISELASRDIRISAFKKGPDYIDAAWLGYLSGTYARNLDEYLMGPEYVFRSFVFHGVNSGFNIIEGNRGLYDGMETGTNSTAELAKNLKAPVILIISPVKTSRTAAAHVLGCMKFDEDVNIAGVILNRIAGDRHRKVITQAIEDICGIPVLGSIPKIKKTILPDRHLGLVTPEEAKSFADQKDLFAELCRDYIDLDRIIKIAESAPELETGSITLEKESVIPKVKIGYISDSAFTFYYPENLEALENAGAELVKISSITDTALPEIDGLYIGGGFPETHADKLQDNEALRYAVKKAAESGLPIYAECGGLIFLSKTLTWDDKSYNMSGVLPITVKMDKKPQGHGYIEASVDRENPFHPVGTKLRGHEFHYTKIIDGADKLETVFDVTRGTGSFDKRDGILYKNVFACYTHIHTASTPHWAENFVKAAEKT